MPPEARCLSSHSPKPNSLRKSRLAAARKIVALDILYPLGSLALVELVDLLGLVHLLDPLHLLDSVDPVEEGGGAPPLQRNPCARRPAFVKNFLWAWPARIED